MPLYRPPISRPQYHQLEAYFFRLAMYMDTVEFIQLPSKKQRRILGEFNYMEVALGILAQLFDAKNNNERPVVAWKEHLDEGETYSRFFKFSCCKVAGLCLGLTGSNVSAVCRGKYPSFKGYVFQYVEDYIADEHLEFDASKERFGFKRYLKERNRQIFSKKLQDE